MQVAAGNRTRGAPILFEIILLFLIFIFLIFDTHYRRPFAVDAFVGHLNGSRWAVATPVGQEMGPPQVLVE
jgi:hypothetical protein